MVQDFLTFAIVDLIIFLFVLFSASVIAFIHDELMTQLNTDYRRIDRFIRSVELAFDEATPALQVELVR